jgi:hypothetical protein
VWDRSRQSETSARVGSRRASRCTLRPSSALAPVLLRFQETMMNCFTLYYTFVIIARCQRPHFQCHHHRITFIVTQGSEALCACPPRRECTGHLLPFRHTAFRSP